MDIFFKAIDWIFGPHYTLEEKEQMEEAAEEMIEKIEENLLLKEIKRKISL